MPLFEACLSRAFRFKSLMDLLFSLADVVSFRVDAEGLRASDRRGPTSVSVRLPASAFESYVFEGPDPLHLGVNQSLQADVKQFKNKSRLRLCVQRRPGEADPLLLRVDAAPATAGEMETSLVLVADRADRQQAGELHPPGERRVEVGAADLAQVCRQLRPGRVTVSALEGRLVLSAGTGGVKIKEYAFGRHDPDQQGILTFGAQAEQLQRLAKAAAFSDAKTVWAEVGQAHLTLTAVSDLGEVRMTVRGQM